MERPMQTGIRRYKRTQYLVAKKFQMKYVGLILVLMLLTALLCSYVVYYTAMIGMGEKLASVSVENSSMANVALVVWSFTTVRYPGVGFTF